jgi:hypothetical protein
LDFGDISAMRTNLSSELTVPRSKREDGAASDLLPSLSQRNAAHNMARADFSARIRSNKEILCWHRDDFVVRL